MMRWCNKGRGLCYPAYGMVHIKDPLLLFGKNNPRGVVAAGSLSRYLNGPLPYVRRQNVLRASLSGCKRK